MSVPVDDCYSWAFQTETDETNLGLLLELQENVGNLSETTGTFRIKDVTDYHPTLMRDEYFWLIGSWEMPERISTSRVTRYVNPNYVHKENYADIAVDCRCGTYLTKEVDKGTMDTEHQHTEDCEREWRMEARAELIDQRKEWLRQAAELWLSLEEAAPRMGVTKNNAWFMTERYGIDWYQLRLQGRERAIWTWRKLHDEYGHTYPEIGRAWGVNPATVRSYAGGHGRNINV